MNERTIGNGPFKMKGSPYKVDPASMAITVGSKVLGNILGHKSEQDEKKLAASKTATDAVKNLKVNASGTNIT
tara:strand:+ start:1650 stop:1868 length:219 start_codon:yes stop_codon:yes gene_type:complete